jgi:hypothetical protein
MGKITTWRNFQFYPMVAKLIGSDNITTTFETDNERELEIFIWESPFKEFDGDEIYAVARKSCIFTGLSPIRETERLLNLSEPELKSTCVLVGLSK